MRYILFLLALSMLIIGCAEHRPIIVEVEFTGSIPIETGCNCDKNPTPSERIYDEYQFRRRSPKPESVRRRR